MIDLTLDDGYVQLLLNRLGRRNDSTLTESVYDELNQAQKQLQYGRFLPWFLWDTIDDGLVSAGVSGWFHTSYDVYLRESDDHPVILTANSDGHQIILKKGDRSALQRKYVNAAQGVPVWYSNAKHGFEFWPTPAEAYTLTVTYYAGQRTIQLGGIASTNGWLTYASDWLLATAGQTLAALHLQNDALAARFARQAAQARDNVMVLHEARLNTNLNFSDDSEFQTS